MSQIPTRRFWAKATYRKAILWAYDLVLAFQRLGLPPEVHPGNISRLRRERWWVAAEWVRRDQSQPSRPAREISTARPFCENPASGAPGGTPGLTDFAKVATRVLCTTQGIL